jgi:hypothetical protein
MKMRFLIVCLSAGLISSSIAAQSSKPAPASGGQARVNRAGAGPRERQKIDEEYTQTIKQNLQDPRITTELVDHLPASDTVPTPLKFLGRAVGAPGELTYAKDIHRYYEALAKASPRAKYWKIGTTEEGRDIVLLAIADEATIKSIDKYRDMLGELTDPRKTSDARARSSCSTRRSRSIGPSAACTHRRPAVPRCSSSSPTASSSKRRRSSRPSATT